MIIYKGRNKEAEYKEIQMRIILNFTFTAGIKLMMKKN